MPETEFSDDLGISDDVEVWRRIPPWPGYAIFDRNEGRVRPSTQAFREDRDGAPMSVFIETESGGVEAVLQGHDGFGLVAFSVSLIREHGLDIVRDPAGGGPGHAVIFPLAEDRRTARAPARIPRRAQEAFALGCRWVVMPAGEPA